MASPGRKIPIQLQLADGATNQFPSAVVKDSSGVALAGSPFALTHSVAGLYVPAAYPLMPYDDFVSVQYLVYSDAGRTTLNTTYESAQDAFLRESEECGSEITGTIEDGSLIGSVEEC